MEQYRELLFAIKEQGTYKPAARANMPATTSLFGYQFRHNLQHGFPLLTTKKVSFKSVVVELLWFLRGDTNIKYLVDNGVNIWNEDAYNYYVKKCEENNLTKVHQLNYDHFVFKVKDGQLDYPAIDNYKLGDCGYQYGRVWREWEKYYQDKTDTGAAADGVINIDQIRNVIKSLKNSPESRRHIVTAIDPAHDTELALYWCHAMFQFNCRPIDARYKHWYLDKVLKLDLRLSEVEAKYAELGLPKYYLDCLLYQRSADVFLGVPFNIASYALLTHILAKICNMVVGEFIHTFGDVHIYDNHMDAVNYQLKRVARELPTLKINQLPFDYLEAGEEFDNFILKLTPDDFKLEGYDPHPAIKAPLSTGLIK